ncbi:MAG: methyltransferase [Acidimicrobiales bacterium]|nr:methyltransferase [Acidimicrobiales bacterium]MCB9395436.1 methyltransferase [Acidimicrobiaceae bacterium]
MTRSSERQYFDDDPSVPSAPVDVTWSLPDGPLVLTTDRGVFGRGQVDTGTKLLLVTLGAPPPTGDLLDLGCGTGAIALTMARRSPGATVWAVDVNRRARELCAANAARHGLTNVRVCAPDEVPDDVVFAEIWSNPPIRIGKAALHDLLDRWLGRLAPGGVAMLVVQKHLGSDSLQRWLSDHGHPTDRLATGAGFRVLRVRDR